MNIEQRLEEPMKQIISVNLFKFRRKNKKYENIRPTKIRHKMRWNAILGKIIGAKKYYYISKALYYKGSPNFQKKIFFFQQIYI